MKGFDLKSMTVAQLVERFTSLGVEQYKAQFYFETAKFNRLFREVMAIEHELKNRTGDQRDALVPLFEHENPQVRLNAAESTLAIVKGAACQTLQEIWDRHEFPQAAFAMQTLRALERGDRIPT